MTDTYDASLGGPESSWQEIDLLLASDKLRAFSPSDWQWLIEQAPTRPAYWQERCAEAAGAIESDFSAPLLTRLLDSDSLQVASIAASELDDLSVRLAPHHEARLLEILAYLERRRSPRADDVKRLLATITR